MTGSTELTSEEFRAQLFENFRRGGAMDRMKVALGTSRSKL
jgi:hypothetical protein